MVCAVGVTTHLWAAHSAQIQIQSQGGHYPHLKQVGGGHPIVYATYEYMLKYNMHACLPNKVNFKYSPWIAVIFFFKPHTKQSWHFF